MSHPVSEPHLLFETLNTYYFKYDGSYDVGISGSFYFCHM